jgi:UDP-N-acetyl-D-mannosaminuronic acid dehydrogenase
MLPVEIEPSPVLADSWKVIKIGVIGPGIVGMPMAAMLAHARIKIGTDKPAKVLVIQRDSINSGWKVNAINSGKSVIGGIEPGLDDIVKDSVAEGLLAATHDFSELHDADVILVSVQTDKKGFEPDYRPMLGALKKLGKVLQNKPTDKIPLVIFESTLAPTTMDTLFREHFKKYGLIEGKDILLGNSPNRVMPGRLIERIECSDKLAGGLHPETPRLISKLYSYIVTKGKVFQTNSLTAEIVKTLENAYRDVRIAFSTEIAHYCDRQNVNFYAVRDSVNSLLSQSDNASSSPNVVPSGGMLIPLLGVGGHCLPKDGILLWWRNTETGINTTNSLILRSRLINDESPYYAYQIAENSFGNMRGKRIALLGVAYRFNSEDTRNSPTLTLANYLKENGISYVMHDPYVKKDDQNLIRFNQESYFTENINKALKDADYIFMCTAHETYINESEKIVSNRLIKGLMDACNIFSASLFEDSKIQYIGIGRGAKQPDSEFINFVYKSFKAMEIGLANELLELIKFYNSNYTFSEYNKVEFKDVQRFAKTCSTGCEITDPGIIEEIPEYKGYSNTLVKCAYSQSFEERNKR